MRVTFFWFFDFSLTDKVSDALDVERLNVESRTDSQSCPETDVVQHLRTLFQNLEIEILGNKTFLSQAKICNSKISWFEFGIMVESYAFLQVGFGPFETN